MAQSRTGKGQDKKSKTAPWWRRLRPRRDRPARRRPILRAFAVASVWIVFGAVLLLAWYAHDLPDTESLGGQTRRPSVTLTTADGRIIASYGDLYGEPLALTELPRHLVDAVLATEDRRFYDHVGVDAVGVLRALWTNLWAGEIRQGGSTLTQQLAKNLFLTPERTIKRKVQETMLALWLERRFTKDEILTIYLNRVYLGAGTYGIDAAARKFFGKSARDLELYESAMLAGLLKAPSRYNPANDPANATARADQVLVNMLDAGMLSEAAAAAGRKVPIFRQPEVRNSELYFADWVLEQVGDHVGYTERDLVVVTTLDTEAQDLARTMVTRALAEHGAELKIGQAALVLMTPDGAVRAMIGGRDYGASQFNRAAQAMRQPGSAFKLFVYLAGLDAGFTPDTRMVDEPIRIGRWRPVNYTGTYRGPVSVREAVARSINTVAVKVSEQAGRPRVIDYARRLGITTELAPRPSLALGSQEVRLVELTGAYAALANGGYPALSYGIAEIRGRDGSLLYRRTPPTRRVLSAGQVGAMNDMLSSVIAWGTGRNADIGRPAAGKTGTSQDWRDAWFIGYTPDYVAGIWVGNDDNAPMDKVTGGGLPALIWREVMSRMHDGRPAARLPGGAIRTVQTPASPDNAGGQPTAPGRVLGPVLSPADELPAPPAGAAKRRAEDASDVFRGPASTRGVFAR